MQAIDERGTSALPRLQLPNEPVNFKAATTGVIGSGPIASDWDEDSPHTKKERFLASLIKADVDLDFSFSVTRFSSHRANLTDTFGSQETASAMAREARGKQEKRVELLEKMRTGTLDDNESAELDALQRDTYVRRAVVTRQENERLRRLLES